MADTHPTKKRIRDTLLLMMKTIDADKINASDLVRQAEVSRATLYRYYDSVDAILNEIGTEFLEGMRDASRYYISAEFDPRNLDRPYSGFVAIAVYIRTHADVFLAMTGPHGDGRFIHKYHKFLQEFYVGKLAYEGMVLANLDVYMEFVLSGNDAVIRYWLEKRQDLSDEEIVPIIQRILYGPFIK